MHDGQHPYKGATLFFAQIALIFLLGSGTAEATLIIVRQTADAIVAGADSFRKFYDGRTTQVCKIHQAGAVCYATAGSGAIDQTDGKDVFQSIIDERLRKSDSLSRKVNDIGDQLIPPLTQMLDTFGKRDPGYFAGRILLDVLIFGFENNNSQVFLVTFEPVKKNEHGALDVTGDIIGFRGRNETIAIGVKTDIGHLRRDETFWQIGAIDGVQQLIEKQSRARPDLVGGNINILRIDRMKASWIKKSPECPDIRSY